MSPRRDLIAAISIVTLLVLAAPLLASLIGDSLGARLIARPTATVTDTYTPTATPIATITPTNTLTPTSTPTPPFTPTSTPRPRAYLVPYVLVFAIGEDRPNPSTQVEMYEGGTDVFELLGSQDLFVRLQTTDAKLNFWTQAGNMSSAPPPPAQYDLSVKGQTRIVVASTVFACTYVERPELAFGVCDQLTSVPSATLIALITANHAAFYIAQIGGAQYIVPFSAIGPVP